MRVFVHADYIHFVFRAVCSLSLRQRPRTPVYHSITPILRGILLVAIVPADLHNAHDGYTEKAADHHTKKKVAHVKASLSEKMCLTVRHNK